MNFAMNQPSPPPLRRFSGLMAVVLLHVLIVYGLASGLARQAVEVIKKPLETKIVEEVKLPPPPPPPPPPKQIKQEIPPPAVAPPPPFVPPPEIVPPVQTEPVVSAVVNTPPPEAPPIAPPAPVAPPGPVRADISVACPKQVAPDMPAKALQDGISGVVKAVVRIKAGRIVDVQIQSGPRVFHNAVRAAMQRYQCVSSGDDEVVATQEFAFKVE